jgi:hypothetical protein
VRADVAAEGEDSGEIYLQDVLPIIIRKFGCGMSTLDPAAVEEDVDFLVVI